MDTLRKKNLIGVLGGMLSLAGLFLPYVRGLSFFLSVSGASYGYFAPALALTIAFATVLYALGLKQLPFAISQILLIICTAFPGYACWRDGFGIVLAQLRIGAWLLFTGLSIMVVYPIFSRTW